MNVFKVTFNTILPNQAERRTGFLFWSFGVIFKLESLFSYLLVINLHIAGGKIILLNNG